MKKYMLLTGIVFMLSMNTSFGQQDPLFSQYFWNKMIVNPAYT